MPDFDVFYAQILVGGERDGQFFPCPERSGYVIVVPNADLRPIVQGARPDEDGGVIRPVRYRRRTMRCGAADAVLKFYAADHVSDSAAVSLMWGHLLRNTLLTGHKAETA